MNGLKYDGWGCSVDAIGLLGIDPKDAEVATSRLNAAREAIEAQHSDGTLGFLALPNTDLGPILDWSKQCQTQTILVLGIGGSSLGVRAIASTASFERRLIVSENVDPHTFKKEVVDVDWTDTTVCVVTKSGSTIETFAKFSWVFDQLKAVGCLHNIVAITDPASGSLREMAAENDWTAFAVPPNVGGRFSVLSPVGLVPLAALGYPIDALLAGAGEVVDLFRSDVAGNPIFDAAWDLFHLYEQGVDTTVLMTYGDRLSGLSEWFCQLWGESLAKRVRRDGTVANTGFTPIRARGAIDQHSQSQLYVEGPANKLVAFLALKTDVDVSTSTQFPWPEPLAHLSGKTLGELFEAERDATQAALAQIDRPTSRWTFENLDAETVGAYLMANQIITAIVGELMNINPYDQPGVELGKVIGHGLLGKPGYESQAEHARALKSTAKRFVATD